MTTPPGIGALPAAAWAALTGSDHPFVDHRFLSALEDCGSVGGDTGWLPLPQSVTRGMGLSAAAPAYLKLHSHGEFVFDWAWAEGYARAGGHWYPKLLIGSPYTPVTGPRLLGTAGRPALAGQLIRHLEDACERLELSSAHVNFCLPEEAGQLVAAGWLRRGGWQFHWRNAGYRDFQDFLEHLRRKPRKNIRQSRRKVLDAGWAFEWHDGANLSNAVIGFAHRCYETTFQLYGNVPMLGADFFHRMARDFGPRFLVCLARRGGRPGAAAIFWRDSTTLYGRYWGAVTDEPELHFETCYHQGIEYCIREGLRRFEPGAQGEHKIRRGFLPVRTHSCHFIRDPGFRDAVAGWLTQEAQVLARYRQSLECLNPFDPN